MPQLPGPTATMAALAAALALAPGKASLGQETRPARPAQISLSVSLALPAPEGAWPGRLAQTEAVRRAIYEVLSAECEVLLASIAAACQLTSANVGLSEQRHSQPAPYLQINGNGTFAVTLKPR